MYDWNLSTATFSADQKNMAWQPAAKDGNEQERFLLEDRID